MNANISLRAGAAVIFTLFSFVFPLSFILAAGFALSIFSVAAGPLVEKPPSHRKIKDLHPTDQTWRDRLNSLNESPAETAFLTAMMAAFALRPVNGTLTGRGLRLQMQVPVGRYRLDFLVDRRLVVEIDGAAYHSSPEAMARDSRRDADLRERGFEILRIPAKVTLYSPQEAVARVEAARAQVAHQDREKTKQLRDSLHPSQIFGALKGAAKATQEGIAKATAYIDCEAAKAAERDALKATAESAATLRKIEHELAGNTARQALLEEALRRFQ